MEHNGYLLSDRPLEGLSITGEVGAKFSLVNGVKPSYFLPKESSEICLSAKIGLPFSSDEPS